MSLRCGYIESKAGIRLSAYCHKRKAMKGVISESVYQDRLPRTEELCEGNLESYVGSMKAVGGGHYIKS